LAALTASVSSATVETVTAAPLDGARILNITQKSKIALMSFFVSTVIDSAFIVV
jgi:hypothetical protein